MFFFLSKTLNYLAMPVVIICILLVASAIFKSAKWRKLTFRAGLFIILFSSNQFIANEFALMWEIPATRIEETPNYEWAILLTGVTRSNIEPDDRVYFQRGADRVIHTVYLYKLGKVKKILVSGGDGNLILARRKEAEEIQESLILMGVNPADIVIEPNSRNTFESAIEVRRIVDSAGLKGPFLLVTSAYHMRRSLACFKKASIDVVPFSTDFLTQKRKFTPDVLIIPRVEAIIIWNILIREWVGISAYWATGKI